jgi:hypothetical protein
VKASTRAALLRLCSHAYPRSVRERDGAALVDLAEELVEGGSSPLREAAGLVRAGTSARLRAEIGAIAQAPWFAARARLALPLAAATFALAAAGAGRAEVMSGTEWVGFSVSVTLAAAGTALVGAAMGRRWLAGWGAFVLTGMLALDAYRDLYGLGSRWHSEVGSAIIDVLVLWIPAGLLLMICAGAVSRVPTQTGIRRLAWTVAPGAILFVVASRQPGIVVADRVVLFGGFLVAAVLVVVAIARRRADRVTPLVAALLVSVAAGPALWLLASLFRSPASEMPALALGYFALGGLIAATAALSLARLGAPSRG